MMVLSICVGAILGALLRWYFGLTLNAVFPTMPLGILVSNLLGGFLIGIFIGITRNYTFPEPLRVGITTGFLGSLTTFSAFSAEVVASFINHGYLWSALIVIFHVAGSVLATIIGILIVKFVMA